MKKYYKVLGLPLDATREDVKNARNNLLKKYHPDIYQGSMSFAEEKSAEINEAFEKISEFLDKQENSHAKENRKAGSDDVSSNQSWENEQEIRDEVRKKREEKERKAKEKIEKQQMSEQKRKIRKENRKKRREEKEKKIQEEIDKEERINRLTKDKPTIENTLIEDERNPEKTEKKILDFLIYGFIVMLILLVILYFTGVL